MFNVAVAKAKVGSELVDSAHHRWHREGAAWGVGANHLLLHHIGGARPFRYLWLPSFERLQMLFFSEP